MRVYVGTYTLPAPHVHTPNQGQGIYHYTLDPATGQLTLKGIRDDITNPSFLAIHPDKRHLYAVSEIGEPEGWVHAFAIAPDSGDLTPLNRQRSAGAHPAYVTTDQTGRAALVANYSPGKAQAAVLPINDDGSLAPATSTPTYQGTGPNAERQEAPHAHCIVTDPTNRFALIVDLGTDKLWLYRLDPERGLLTANDRRFVKLPPGSGPRHLTFHPNGRFAYVICELNSTLHTLAYDNDRGTFEIKQTVSTLPEGYDGPTNYPAEVCVTRSGNYLYGSNRGHDSLAIYSIDEQSGALTLVGHLSCGGKWPRNFAIDPTDTFVIVANQDSDSVVTFRIDHATGRLNETGFVAQCPSPVCVRVVTSNE